MRSKGLCKSYDGEAGHQLVPTTCSKAGILMGKWTLQLLGRH